MAYRMSSKASRGRFLFMCLSFLAVATIVYYWWSNAQETYKNVKWAEKRCLSELSSVKYQLDVVTEYKSHVETTLAECQKAHNLDKDKFKDVAESCLTMKQQSSLCQNQFDDLQNECKKVRETYNKEKTESELLKEKLEDEARKREEAQKTIDEMFSEVENLRILNRNQLLNAQDRPADSRVSYGRPPAILYHRPEEPLRAFSTQNEVAPGEYEVAVKTSSTQKKVQGAESEIHGAAVPPGFAPVLKVVEHPDSSIQKPQPETDNGAKEPDPEELRQMKEAGKINDKDLEIVDHVQDPKNGEDSVLNVPLDGDKQVMEDNNNDDNNNADGNHPAQEDDDEGEEYPNK